MRDTDYITPDPVEQAKAVAPRLTLEDWAHVKACAQTVRPVWRKFSVEQARALLAVLDEQAAMVPHQGDDYGRTGPHQITRRLAERAYVAYSAKYGTDQSLDRLLQRGGFGNGELDMFVPGWRDEPDNDFDRAVSERARELNGERR